MNNVETVFVNTFIARDRRERWLSLLSSEKGRGKLVDRLAHVFLEDLDPRFVFSKENRPSDVAARVQTVLDQWELKNPEGLCQIIANNVQIDGQSIRLAEAEVDDRLTFGAIIIVIPDRLAYYHTERSNLNKQPYYLLFHS